MIDKEQLAIMIRDIEKYLSDLDEINITKKEDLEEKEKYYAVSMVIFAIMNRTIDIGNEVIAGKDKISLPTTYKETFELLQCNKIISKKTAENMIFLTKYRNAIAHDYYKLTASEIFSLKNRVGDVLDYIKEIKKAI